VSGCLTGVTAAEVVWVDFIGMDGEFAVSFFSTTMVLCSTDDENCGSLLVLENGSGASLENYNVELINGTNIYLSPHHIMTRIKLSQNSHHSTQLSSGQCTIYL